MGLFHCKFISFKYKGTFKQNGKYCLKKTHLTTKIYIKAVCTINYYALTVKWKIPGCMTLNYIKSSWSVKIKDIWAMLNHPMIGELEKQRKSDWLTTESLPISLK